MTEAAEMRDIIMGCMTRFLQFHPAEQQVYRARELTVLLEAANSRLSGSSCRTCLKGRVSWLLPS